MPRPSVRLVADGEDPLRAELAAAIAEGTQAERALEAARTAVPRAAETVASAEARLAATSAEVTAARTAQVDRLASGAATGEQPSVDRSMRDARARETDCADDLEAAKAALARVEAAVPDAEEALARTRARVSAAADAITATAVPVLIAEAEQLRDRLAAVRAVLRHLRADSLGPFGGPHERERAAIDEFLAAPFLQPELELGWCRRHPAAARWLAAREALTRDAGATLPVER